MKYARADWLPGSAIAAAFAAAVGCARTPDDLASVRQDARADGSPVAADGGGLPVVRPDGPLADSSVRDARPVDARVSADGPTADAAAGDARHPPDAGVPPDALAAPPDAREPAADAAPPPYAEFLPLGMRVCEQICDCSNVVFRDHRCAVRYSECANEMTVADERASCAFAIASVLANLRDVCAIDPVSQHCVCDGFDQCIQWAQTATCDPVFDRVETLLDRPLTCTSGSEFDNVPECPYGWHGMAFDQCLSGG